MPYSLPVDDGVPSASPPCVCVTQTGHHFSHCPAPFAIQHTSRIVTPSPSLTSIGPILTGVGTSLCRLVGQVCDSTCTVGRYGGYNCDWRNYGSTCRYCFDNVQAALVADVVAKRRGGRVIMCDTHEPPREDPVVDQSVADARISSQRRLVPAADKIAHPHKEREFSKRVAAAQTPKWKHEKRWLQSG